MQPLEKKFRTFFKRFVLPIASLFSCLVMIFAAIYSHGIKPMQDAQQEGRFAFPVLFYLIVFAVIMIIGAVLKKQRKNK